MRPPMVAALRDAAGRPSTRAPLVNVYPKTEGDNQYFILSQDYDYADSGPADRAVSHVFAKGGYVYDVLEGRLLGHGQRLDAVLDVNTVRVIAVLPYAVTALRTDAPAQTAAGQDARIPASVVAEHGPVGLHVFRVDVVDPEGTPHRAYSQNVLAPQGRADIVVPFALNDKPGPWRVRIQDVATGAAAALQIDLAPPAPARQP